MRRLTGARLAAADEPRYGHFGHSVGYVHFGMVEVERQPPLPTVILQRDGTRLGFAVNGGDPSQDGAAILVSNIHGLKDELDRSGAEVGEWRGGKRLQLLLPRAARDRRLT